MFGELRIAYANVDASYWFIWFLDILYIKSIISLYIMILGDLLYSLSAVCTSDPADWYVVEEHAECTTSVTTPLQPEHLSITEYADWL